ncbi:hypothetical protein COU36_01580 [Candidatus Micrarchaeota archaeon CG10_big_fil_rev_8_21_14_0_10_59_7]|nr:MAG: hypothetical protein COU36_01580 [Candidatus Micrarchaeota archaeon CG10_big_fil_rev_8_21_14_0_10_59_7]
MDDETLFRACCLLAMLGIAGLWFFGTTITPEERTVDELNDGDVGRLVIAWGRIQGIRVEGGNAFFNLCGKRCVSVAVFRADSFPVDFRTVKSGRYADVEGVFDEDGIVARSVELK